MTSAADNPPPQPSDGPGLRRFILPALFVAMLFGALWARQSDTTSSPDGSDSADGWIVKGEALGTTWTVKGSGVVSDAKALEADLAAALSAVDQSMSTWKKDSELSRLNRAGTAPFTVSAELLTVLCAAEAVSVATEGAFDITVGPLVAAWGFGAGKKETPPTADAIATLRTRVGYRKLQLDSTASTVTRNQPNVTADLSAIAKGYAVDRMGAVLTHHGITNWMVEVGGEVRVSGTNSAGKAWRLGIEKPTADGRAVAYAIELDAGALATSGDYRQFRTVDGKTVSHTIDPRTAKPVAHGPASVSVVATDCMTADAWATALMVLGPKGLSLATKRGLGVLILERHPDGSVVEHMNDAFEAQLLRK